MEIAKDTVVSMHYTLTDDAGKVLDSSDGREPLNYLHGAGNIIPGLEGALVGKKEGDSLKVTVPPAEGYGEVNEELIQKVDRSAFQGVEKVEVGMAFEAKNPDGSAYAITIREINGDQITIDANHALAGVTLHFDVSVEGVREATAEELSHGHVHG